MSTIPVREKYIETYLPDIFNQPDPQAFPTSVHIRETGEYAGIHVDVHGLHMKRTRTVTLIVEKTQGQLRVMFLDQDGDSLTNPIIFDPLQGESDGQ